MPSVIVGMDTIPVEIHTTDPDTGALFKRFLPGWEGAGEYNFRAGTSSQRAAAQLEVLMQSGPHPYINNQIRALLKGAEFAGLDDPEKTRRLAALVNFMGEASGTSAITSKGARTGGYVAFSSASDPHLSSGDTILINLSLVDHAAGVGLRARTSS